GPGWRARSTIHWPGPDGDRITFGRRAPPSHRATGTRPAALAAGPPHDAGKPGRCAAFGARFAGFAPDREAAADRRARAVSEVHLRDRHPRAGARGVHPPA